MTPNGLLLQHGRPQRKLRGFINTSPSIPRRDRLIDSFAKLFPFYYFHKSGLHNFYSCFPPDGEEYLRLRKEIS